ncbi:trehalose-phosphate synthase [Kocuria flava]|uniref:Trehalose-phosphate synthase n=1 Tax=Kocuria flava TaxID=446860 RepID=A0A0U3G8P9_9MICC|nr:trehalose-6-phosphate synthase [Kocuria flava]ALU39451.1 trehalose-phosphate synthase [Kocuria flava]GEO92822.1 putative alpha,alpha-trehalose-phosphate synthase [Kocuria flava]
MTSAPHPDQSPAPAAAPGQEGGYDFVVVSNRLPVERTVEAGEASWRRSPGGLVAALSPVMARNAGAWVGWHGAPDEVLERFDHDVFHLAPVPLSEQEVADYYEGFSNATLWPLYHDVIAPPEFHRTWWNSYRTVNRRFAERTAEVAAQGATVWVQDYQLQLVPRLLRELRPDLTIGFFNHIPFPPLEIFGQLPWRRAVLEGLAGADLIGFQRPGDAQNFQRCVRRFLDVPFKQGQARFRDGADEWTVHARSYPISIDSGAIEELASRPEVRRRAEEIRHELGDPETVFLGVDRLDYTKGILHRIKAYGELLEDGSLTVGPSVLVQVANPSRERVESYVHLREQVEGLVGHINGQFDTISHTAVRYLHHGYPFEEMVALYLATDVMLVTSLRDGMNLVAKEYVAARADGSGVLVLSEFTGAAEQLKQALLVNPHDIDGLKATMVRAKEMPPAEAKKRMRAMRRHVMGHDVTGWSEAFLRDLARARAEARPAAGQEEER